MAKKTKLELTWIGKNDRPKLEPRILIEDPDKSHYAKERQSENDIFDNILIHGDNLLALKALEHDYAGKVKCVFIDPPYNTGSAFSHYDDGLEHSLWLSLMRERIESLRVLLSDDGSIWVSLDDNEFAYFKVVMDEIFGRENFIATNIWRKNYSPKSSSNYISVDHDYILVYAKNKQTFVINELPRTDKQNSIYKNPDNDPRGPWTSDNLSARNPYSRGIYSITTPSGAVIEGPPTGRYWAISKEKLEELDADGRIYWTKGGAGTPRLKRFLSDVKGGRVPQSLWGYEEVGHTQDAKKESVALFPKDPFPTPKPEALIERVLTLATNPGDLVVDTFAGSGTTGAVAHKMRRAWIMAELHDHCHTHIMPRLKKVIDGEDPGGITDAVNWKGGGGFRYFNLAPSLLEQDKYGNWVISKEYQPEMLAESMCKHMGFTYAPSTNPEEYWQHGHSTETDFIYVTTQALTHAALTKISEDVGPDRSLLICCKAFSAQADAFDNLTIIKIPQTILRKCEWGRDDYSLNVSNLPMAEPDDPDAELPLFAADGEDQA